MGNINRILATQYNQAEVFSLFNPINSVTGAANLAAVDPVTAKTIIITAICKLDSMPQRFFSLSIQTISGLKDKLYMRGKKGPSRWLYLR